MPAEGIRITGHCDLEGKGLGTSFCPGEKDAVRAAFNGGLFWPPVSASPGPAEKLSLVRVAGPVTATGAFAVPLGSCRAKLAGRLSTTLDWRLREETLALDDIRFEGFDCQVEGTARFTLAGPDVGFVADAKGSINAASLLKGLGLTLPEGMLPPRLLKGKTAIAGNRRSLRFDKMSVEMDGAPISGEIARQASADGDGKGSDSALWTLRLSADRPDFDALFPPDPPDGPFAPPSKTPWNLTPLKGLGIDAQISLSNMKKDRLTVSGTKVTATLQQDRFSLHAAVENF